MWFVSWFSETRSCIYWSMPRGFAGDAESQTHCSSPSGGPRRSNPLLLSTDGLGLGNVLPRIGVHPHRETNRRRPTEDVTGIRDQHFAIQGLRSPWPWPYPAKDRPKGEPKNGREALADPTTNLNSRVALAVWMRLWHRLPYQRPQRSGDARHCRSEGETSVYKKRKLTVDDFRFLLGMKLSGS